MFPKFTILSPPLFLSFYFKCIVLFSFEILFKNVTFHFQKCFFFKEISTTSVPQIWSVQKHGLWGSTTKAKKMLNLIIKMAILDTFWQTCAFCCFPWFPFLLGSSVLKSWVNQEIRQFSRVCKCIPALEIAYMWPPRTKKSKTMGCTPKRELFE